MTGQAFTGFQVSGDGQNLVGARVGGNVIQRIQQFVRGRPALYLPASEIDDRVECHVPARNHGLVVKSLERDHAVMLGGPPGCGRETSAIAALRYLLPGVRIRRFSADSEDVEEVRAGGPRGYLIRAADETPEGVRACLDAAREVGGYVAVIGDGTQWRRLAPPIEFVEVLPPDPVEVFRRRMLVRGLAAWAGWATARLLLADALPGDARRLAEIAEEVVARAEGRASDTGIEALQEEVARSYQGWQEHLRTWFARNEPPQDRTLLLSTAALEPAPAEDVYSAAVALAGRLRVDVNGAGLAWYPATSLPELLETQAEDGRFAFRRHGFGPSALRHAWADYPLMRADLLAWLTGLVLDDLTRPGTQNRIAETLGDLAAEHGHARAILDAAKAWAEADLPDPAYIVLSRTCLHTRVGGRVRRGLYEWSKSGGLHQTLKLTVARVCEPLGRAYPSIALTRLKHLATRGNLQVRQEVADAAVELARAEHRGEVLAAVLGWCRPPAYESLSEAARDRRARTGAVVFLRLAGDGTGHGIPAVLELVDALACEPAWRAAVTADKPALGWEEPAVFWLDAALAHPGLRDGIVRMFVGAARPAPDAMIGLVRGWAAADPARRRIRDAIVLGLSRPWWLWLARWLAVWVRTLLERR
ncbi:hypothetical protein [Actinomadura sp. WMMB 499]|uniref:hypothetical protein n=1 Tax=Actinomadura sp. WMMB 499 TaxID=1219491 RepID=UPI0012460C9D|nr:hypothetical protein [Actinomadura sp. WMMB 499]QFG24206.1 hypothetical protein F7P10_26865 [Actinomadura sp. WMMB 499]